MKKKLLEIEFCIECPHCNGHFICAKLGRAVDEIPEDCPLDDSSSIDLGVGSLDSKRLDFLEQQTRVSPTGISFDFAQGNENGQGGYRFMRYHKLHQRKPNIREAIDDALFVFNPQRAK